MTEGIFALAGVLIGLLGAAVTERWRHSYVRRDARTDRQAATLREALDAYTEFVLAWSSPTNKIGLGGKVDMLDPAMVAGPPGQAQQKLTAITERIHVESIRLRMGEFIDRVVRPVAEGKVTAATVEANMRLGTQVAADIGTELRKLEAQ